jgi:hypothetical protein
MSDVAKLAAARSLLRISAHVATYRGPGDRRIFLVTPAGFCRRAMIAAAVVHPAMTVDSEFRVVVHAVNADDGTALLTLLSECALPSPEEPTATTGA